MSALYKASRISNERWVNSLPDEFEKVTFSKKHERKMNVLFSRMRGGSYHRLSRRAVIALIAAIVTLLIATSVTAVPKPQKFKLEQFSDHGTYAVINAKRTEADGFTLGYIPDGYELSKTEKSSGYYFEEYKGIEDDDYIYIKQLSLNDEFGFDNEHGCETVMINGVKTVHYSYTDGYNGYIWNDGRNVYCLSTNSLSHDEVIKIIKSIKSK